MVPGVTILCLVLGKVLLYLGEFFQVYFYNQRVCLASLSVSGMLGFGAGHVVDA